MLNSKDKPQDTDDAAEAESSVDRIHQKLRDMAMSYSFKPGERINEGALVRLLGVSRTPIREALNRLSVEGFLTIRSGKGFFCRELDPVEIFQLYQLRSVIECGGIALSVKLATAEQILEIEDFLRRTGPEAGDRSTEELVSLDETFHEELMKLSQNAEMLEVLKNIDRRIRFVRWIHMDDSDRPKTQREHRLVLEALKERDAVKATEVLSRHIERRHEEIMAAIREGYSRIYMPGRAG